MSLSLQDFSVSIDTKGIIHNISHTFESGSTTAILGHNGSGKTSLALALMWHPRYQVSGSVLVNGEAITQLWPTERAHRGMFLSFQNIPEIPGIELLEYLRTIYLTWFRINHPDKRPPTPFVFRRLVESLLPELNISTDFLKRDLFVGFSWGEKRRIELLQIALLNPHIIILDEIDSGLDIDALNILKKTFTQWKKDNKTVICISHNTTFLENITLDQVIIMDNGIITKSGNSSLLQEILIEGFQ